MSNKTAKGFSRQRSSSLRLFISKEGKSNQSSRPRYQSTGSAKQALDKLTSNPSSPLPIKHNMVKEAMIRIRKLDADDTKSAWNKLRSYVGLRWTWESCTIVLGEKEFYFTVADGVFEPPMSYVCIESLEVFGPCHSSSSYIRMCTEEAYYFFQVTDLFQRDRLLNSLQWKKNVSKYEKILQNAINPEVIAQELQNLVQMTLESPLNLDDTHNTLLNIVSKLLQNVQNDDTMNPLLHEDLITTLAPLLEKNQPSLEICKFFTRHCRDCPRSCIVIDVFTPVVQRILIYNTNFGKNIWLRTFVKEYIQALNAQNDGETAVRSFIRAMHGPLSTCPHIRILNNLAAVCLSSIYDAFTRKDASKDEKCWELHKRAGNGRHMGLSHVKEEKNMQNARKLRQNAIAGLNEMEMSKFNKNHAMNRNSRVDLGEEMRLTEAGIAVSDSNVNLMECHSSKEEKAQHGKSECQSMDSMAAIIFAQVLDEISRMGDWLPGLAVLLQPIPFQKEAVQDEKVQRYLVQIVENIMQDGRDEVVWCLVSQRDNKDGWLQTFGCHKYEDGGKLFIRMTEALLSSAKVCSKTKKLVTILQKTCLDSVLLLALRESEVMIEILCLLLKYKLLTGQKKEQAVSTLRSTTLGKTYYEHLCDQQTLMRQKGGPHECTLPPQSTDQDLKKFLSSGSYGNLKNLNLSFTHISCKSAEIISRLPALQHLNLWSTNIRDIGLRRICESLNLKSLNLCETRVTDESIGCLKDMTNLVDLNLNSTPVSDGIYQELRGKLPNLLNCNVDYTEVWPQGSVEVQNNAAVEGKEPSKKLEFMQNI